MTRPTTDASRRRRTPVDETTSWRGLAEVDADEAAERMTAGTARRRLEAAAARAAARRTSGRSGCSSRSWSSRTPPGWRSPTWSRRASTPASRRSATSDDLEPLLVDRRAACWSRRSSRRWPGSCSWCGPGQIGQDVLFELRRRVFRHFQALSPAFHDSYTSGRVISRQTSDVDAIYEMLETGFDGLVTAALTLVGTAGLLLFLDVQLGLVALLCGPVPAPG